MSSFLDTRKEFLRCVGHSDLPRDFKIALAQVADAKPEQMNKKFPEFGAILKLSYKSQFIIFDFFLHQLTDSEERSTEEFEDESQEKMATERQPLYLNRPFDCVDKFDKLLQLEKSAKVVNLLSSHRDFIVDRKACNKQCIIGFVCVMFRNDIFKSVYINKPGPDKSFILYDALEYCQKRYNFGSLETGRKGLDHCIELALNRIPGLREFDERNYQKNQTKFKNQKS